MTTPTNLRLSTPVRERLDAYAERTRRTLAAAADVLLAEALDADDRRREATQSRHRS